MADKLTAKNLLKTDGIISCNPRDSLSQALAKLSSSHDAVFVVDGKNELLGVISPFQVLKNTNYQHSAKVENYLFSPPKLRELASVQEIAKNMLESKIYYLPVFSQNNKWLGIVSVRSLLRAISQDPDLIKDLKIPKRKEIFTISEKATLKEARALQQDKRISRLPVVNRSGQLTGILTRYELQEAFSVPKSSPRFLSRQGEKKKFADKPISGYFIRSVVTANEKTSLSQMIQTMLDKEVGSIVIVNNKWQPVNILTTSDLLKNLSLKGKPHYLVIDLDYPANFSYQVELKKETDKLKRKLTKFGNPQRIVLKIAVVREDESKRKLYEITAKAFFSDKQAVFASAQSFEWKLALKQVRKKLQKQLQ